MMYGSWFEIKQEGKKEEKKEKLELEEERRDAGNKEEGNGGDENEGREDNKEDERRETCGLFISERMKTSVGTEEMKSFDRYWRAWEDRCQQTTLAGERAHHKKKTTTKSKETTPEPKHWRMKNKRRWTIRIRRAGQKRLYLPDER